MGKIYSSSVKRSKPLVGVTGIIGSGKTTVSRLFGKLGAAIFDADVAARKSTEDVEIISRIGETFGNQIFDSNGILDRKKLANIVFSSESKLRQLNSIVHPHVRKQMWNFVEVQQELAEVALIIIDSPLIYETDLYTHLDFIVVVSSDIEACIQRVQQRNGLSREEIQDRLSRQIPLEKKIKRADFNIDNNNQVKSLNKHVQSVFTNIMRKWESNAD
ncbi:dephospho-CoA kinase [candidate division KSB1 bacterium]|nr:dephospho-CoA kinase [candidate division KSB1 bacterium]